MNLLKQMGAETIGTFCLVFAGTFAIVSNDISDGAVTHVGIALTFGLVVMAMIFAIGKVSGAHINPAVTIAFLLDRRLNWKTAVAYIASQCVGAIVASLVVYVLCPLHETLGATVPRDSVEQTFLLEFILTFMLMFVIFCVSTGAKEEGVTAAIAIGAVVAFEALIGGPISGASMNPARSLGPAVVSMKFEVLWIYLAAPVLGAAAAVPVWWCLRETNNDSANEAIKDK